MSERLPDHALRRALDVARDLADAPREGSVLLGRYRLERELGRGGMGVVHEAFDLELRRTVALKLLALPPGAGPDARERFVREARAAAQLDHPNIAKVYEATPDALVLEFVDGTSIAAVARGDPRRIARLLRDAARAVHHAHERGIVHRDLKPANLLLAGERVVVTDFGLAKDLRADASLSLSGHVLGTPTTMAPEQAEGRVRDVDARTDVWGLGATLYELLVGRPTFEESDVMRLLRRIAEDDPPAPRVLRPELSIDLERVVLKCLEKDPIRRYPSAAALAEDLERWLEGKPVIARAPTLGYRVTRFVQRHRALVTLSGAALFSLAAAGTIALDQHARRAGSTAALALSEDVAGVLEDAALHQRLGDPERAAERLQQGIDACRAFLSAHDVPHAHFLLGRLLRASGDTEAARAELSAAIDADPDLVDARFERGLLAQAHDGPVPSGEPRDAAVQDLRAALDSGRLRHVDAVQARAEIARLTGALAEARRAYDEVLRLDPLRVSARYALLRIELEEGNGDAAWGLAMSAVDLHRGFGPAYLARASAYGATGRGADPVQRAVMQHQLEAAESRIDAGDGSTDALSARASARLHLDDVDGALADFSAALRADPSDAMAFGNRSLVHARRAAEHAAAGRVDAALAAWSSAIDDATAALTIEPSLTGALNNRGIARLERERLLSAQGRLPDAQLELRLAGMDFDDALLRDPGFVLANLNRAIQRRAIAASAVAAGDAANARAALRGADEDLDAVRARRPDDESARIERALLRDVEAAVLLLEGRPAREVDAARDRARAAFDAAVLESPHSPRAVGLRALHRLRRGDRQGFVTDARAALERAPDSGLRTALERALATE